jgi:hypothetical protein
VAWIVAHSYARRTCTLVQGPKESLRRYSVEIGVLVSIWYAGYGVVAGAFALNAVEE